MNPRPLPSDGRLYIIYQCHPTGHRNTPSLAILAFMQIQCKFLVLFIHYTLICRQHIYQGQTTVSGYQSMLAKQAPKPPYLFRTFNCFQRNTVPHQTMKIGGDINISPALSNYVHIFYNYPVLYILSFHVWNAFKHLYTPSRQKMCLKTRH